MATKADTARFEKLFSDAHLAGLHAVSTMAPPEPMIVAGTGLDERGRVVTTIYPPVLDGVCGFAWVTIRPGTSSFAKWLVKNGHARAAYGGGVQVWVSYFNQSMAKKETYASAFADTLEAAGIKAYAGSRMD